MPIITISRGSYSKGKEIAEKVAACLEYRCLPRELVLKEASEKCKIPEVALVRAIHDAPSILGRLGYKKEKYTACLQSVILRHFQGDNVIYHGLAGHFFVQGIPHVLKVRILADLEDRVRWEMEREKISAKEARRILLKDDEERRKWSRHMYGVDTWDPHSYDMVLYIKRIAVDDAVDIICRAASLPGFQATNESRGKMDDLVIASDVRAALMDKKPDAEVVCENGVVSIRTTVSLTKEMALVEDIRRIASAVPGVKEVNVKAHSAFMDI